MQAIITKVLPATNTKPTRIKASCERGSIVVSYDHSGSSEEAHRDCARGLCNKFCREDEKTSGSPFKSNPWNADFVSGQIPGGDYVHVFTTAPEFLAALRAANLRFSRIACGEVSGMAAVHVARNGRDETAAAIAKTHGA